MLNFLVSQIYVPICTSELYWYLVVVDIDEGIVFQMDSFLQPGDLVPREMRISMVVSFRNYISCIYFIMLGNNRMNPHIVWFISQAEALCQCTMSSHYEISLAGK